MSNGATTSTPATTADDAAVAEPIVVQIDERAVLARVNRALKPSQQNLRKCRSDSAAHEKLGSYYLVSLDPPRIVRTHVDLAALASELQVLEPYEQVGA